MPVGVQMKQNAKINVVWDVEQCNLVDYHLRFGGTCCFYPEDGGKFLQNVLNDLPDYTATIIFLVTASRESQI
jgi:hypothetical protein